MKVIKLDIDEENEFEGIDAVASKEKYDVILNANSVAFINPDNDISKLVLEQIGKIN